MLGSTKTLSLVEQKKLQWAKERGSMSDFSEEMVGLCGLWGRPRNNLENSCINIKKEEILAYNKNNLLPPLVKDKECEESVKELYKEEESETSGYLSDSPKHLQEDQSLQQSHYLSKGNDHLNNEEICEEVSGNYTNEIDKSENYWADKKMYKNYKNENWAQQNNNDLSMQNQKMYQINKNYWLGTPESVSSDDGCRLRWGDRGVGIGHLWEPVVNRPDSRLPQVSDPYRQAPKWVEKGLKNCDGSQADILIINHPDDDEQYLQQPQKNFLLGQNVPIPPDVIEERERKRKKALEHQNAIKKQLEERELKRKHERENRLKEEKLEEERIRKEQELERRRYEEELKKIKEKAEMEKKKEEAMREAIEEAEKRAREEKRRNKRHIVEDINQKNLSVSREKLGKMEKTVQPRELSNATRKTGRIGQKNKSNFTENFPAYKEQNEKALKDSSSQFEEIQLANSFQLLNMNGVPVDGGLAFMLESQSKDNNFFIPPDGMQLALLMSPRNPGATNRLVPLSPPVTGLGDSAERTLTPSKYRIMQRLHSTPTSKSTQTDLKLSSTWFKNGSAGKRRKVSVKCGIGTENGVTAQKLNTSEKYHKHVRSLVTSKYRSRPHLVKANLEDRPKWGINRPSVQYKKQSEKDPYYQKKMKERLKNFNESSYRDLKNEEKTEDEEKELDSVSRLLDFQSDEDGQLSSEKRETVLLNGFRMNSNSSSPVFVPIDTGNQIKNSEINFDKSNDPGRFETDGNEVINEDDDEDEEEEEEDTVVPGSVGFLTQTQLDALQKITNLREGLKNLQKSYSDSRSITPLSAKSTEELPQVLDLSKVKITSKEDFKKNLDKIPECKVKPEKILPDSIKIKDKDFTFVPGKKEEKQVKEWSYSDPLPSDMKGAKLEELFPVNIDWKMLTTLRPKTKIEEDMFSRIVQLGKLDLKYQQNLKREKSTDWIRKTKNPKSSIVEMRVISCKECGEDFCDGSMCSKLMYENFFRFQPVATGTTQTLLLPPETEEKTEKKKKKKKKRRKHKSRKRSLDKKKRAKSGKNSIFNRPISRGCTRDHSGKNKEVLEKYRRRAVSSTRSFSCEKKLSHFSERRSKSAPRIHFDCETTHPRYNRYEYNSDSMPSHTDYSSQSDSESPDFHRKYFPSHLVLSGRRKLLSARVGFIERKQRSSPESSNERSPSKFVRLCTLYKNYNSDASFRSDHNNDRSSGGSTPSCSRSVSKSPERNFPTASTSRPPTIQIYFDDFYSPSPMQFPDRMILPRPIPIALTKRKEVLARRQKELQQKFFKLKQENEKVCRRRKKKGNFDSKVSFTNSYLKAKSVFKNG